MRPELPKICYNLQQHIAHPANISKNLANNPQPMAANSATFPQKTSTPTATASRSRLMSQQPQTAQRYQNCRPFMADNADRHCDISEKISSQQQYNAT
jgi:hypothetical protein